MPRVNSTFLSGLIWEPNIPEFSMGRTTPRRFHPGPHLWSFGSSQPRARPTLSVSFPPGDRTPPLGPDGSTPSLPLATRRRPSSLRLTAAHPRDAPPPVLVTRRRPTPPPSFLSLLLPRWRAPSSLILVIQTPPFPLHRARRPHRLPIVLPLSRHRRPASVQATQHVSSLPLLLPRVSTPLANLICFRYWRFQSLLWIGVTSSTCSKHTKITQDKIKQNKT
jgi:hypothetical protein